MKILSIMVADEEVTRVGLFIWGMKEFEKFARMKSLVGGWVSVLSRSRL